ncbi:MAG: hypothetical protein WBE92_09720 [Steroidobacteraceae bacterium]
MNLHLAARRSLARLLRRWAAALDAPHEFRSHEAAAREPRFTSGILSMVPSAEELEDAEEREYHRRVWGRRLS